MICHLLKRHFHLGLLFRIALRFLDTTVSSAMGCFIGCFRARDDRCLPSSSSNLVSNSSLPKQKEAAISRNDLSSLFLAEEKQDSPSKHGESLGSPVTEERLKDEAKFLKACGTLTQTPVEVRKVSEKSKFSPTNGRESEPSKFHSWLTNTSVEKLPSDFKLHQPQSPVNVSDQWGTASEVSERTSSCISSAQNDGRFSTETNEASRIESCYTAKKANANQSEKVDTPLPCRTKSVRFDCETDMSTSGSSSGGFSRSTKNTGTSDNQSANNPFLYPTPQKLSDVMQTPGTVFPSALENLPNCKPRVRSQFVYSVHTPVESDTHWKLLQEEDLYREKHSGEMIDQHQSKTPKTDKMGSKEISSGTELKQEGSLSDWFKPRALMVENIPNITNRNIRPPKTPGDRPIIGIVATHWNEEETSRVTPKWWDGNGIPNSTTKYKEDQKVSWHATPFEERLEKALSEETLISRNDSHGKLIAFDENEENDTALSQLQASTQPKSVVSF